MNAIKAQLARIQGQLALLSPSQRLLAISLVAILVLTVAYWGRYAATTDRVAITGKALSPEQTQLVVDQLKGMNIDASIRGGLIMVPPGEAEFRAISMLALEAPDGVDSSEAVDSLMKRSTLWDSAAKTAALENQRKELLLSQMFKSWPGVSRAKVMIDPTTKRSLSGTGTQPRATVDLHMMKGHTVNQKMVQAAASAVAGVNSGMPMGNVTVNVNGNPQRVMDPSDPTASGLGASTFMETKRARELEEEKKVRDLLNIANLLVQVSVDVDTTSSVKKETSVDPKNIIHKETRSKERTMENSTNTPAGGDVGATPNTGQALPASATAGANTANSTTDTETEYALSWGTSETQSTKPAGETTVKGVAIRIPRSYFRLMAKDASGKKDVEPDEATVEKLKGEEMKSIASQVALTTGMADASRVSVSDYVYIEPEAAPAGSAGVPVLSFVNSYGKEVALGVLALAAMAMVSGIVKKSGAGVPAAVSAAAALGAAAKDAGPGGIDRLAGGHEIVGAATEGGGALEAMELDEETSQTQQMVDQVATMVKENPDAATALIKRWMARD